MVLRKVIRDGFIRNVAVDSAATTREEIGNDIYPPMKKALLERPPSRRWK